MQTGTIEGEGWSLTIERDTMSHEEALTVRRGAGPWCGKYIVIAYTDLTKKIRIEDITPDYAGDAICTTYKRLEGDSWEVEFEGSGALWANNDLAERRVHDLFGQSV